MTGEHLQGVFAAVAGTFNPQLHRDQLQKNALTKKTPALPVSDSSGEKLR